jgi:hypothetical protein
VRRLFDLNLVRGTSPRIAPGAVTAYPLTRLRIGNDDTKSNYGLRGWIPDGALFRVSTVGVPRDVSFEVQDEFIRDLLNAVTPETRKFMVGILPRLCWAPHTRTRAKVADPRRNQL